MKHKVTNFNCNNCNNTSFINRLTNAGVIIDKQLISKTYIFNIFGNDLTLNDFTFDTVLFKQGSLTNSVFKNCNFINVTFDNVNLNNVQFLECKFTNNCSIFKCNGTGINFSGSIINNTLFELSIMDNCVFINTHIQQLTINITNTIMNNCDFNNAIIDKIYTKLDIIPNMIENGYTLLKKLGQGSYGEVWLAQNNNELVVIKSFAITSSDIFNSDDYDYIEYAKEQIENMNSEYNALIDISSECSKYAICYRDTYIIKNVIIFNNNNKKPIIYENYKLVLDYIHGYTLESMVEYINNNCIKELYIKLQNNYLLPYCLIKGIDIFHKLGVAHHDIKIDNIMFDINSGNFRYIDWGVACLKKYCDDKKCNKCYPNGNEMTEPPELDYELNIGLYDELTFNQAKAYDYWTIGIILLQVYIPSAINFNFAKLKTQDTIDRCINLIQKSSSKINPLFIKIVRYLLEVNIEKRVDNFSKVVEIVENLDKQNLSSNLFIELKDKY
jgi:serine/threonine protein kinase